MLNQPVKKQPRVLGAFSLVMINIIAVDSLRSLPFSAEYGFSLVAFYLLAAVAFFIPTALVAAELATGWPTKGGVYVWVREAFGDRWGFFVIWLQWVYNVVWYPTILSFLAGALAYLIHPDLASSKVYLLSTILVAFWGATLVNCLGMRISGAISTVGALVGTLIPMTLIIILGGVWLIEHNTLQIQLSWHTAMPQFGDAQHLVFLIAVLFGLVGMEMSAVHADEVKNPGNAYPKAIFYSALIILFSLIFSSLAIAIVVPHDKLNVVTGLVQAFQIFFSAYHMTWMNPIVTAFIIIGGIGGVAAWIIGPTKGLLVATRDGNAPPILAKTNKKGVPIAILLMQAGLFTIICSVFLLMPTVSSSYWILTAITAQLALLVYVFMFAAALRLRYKHPQVKRAYRIPLGNLGMWIVCVVGTLTCLTVIALGFLPPTQVNVGNITVYETILIVGMLVVSAPPLIIHAFKKPEWKSS